MASANRLLDVVPLFGSDLRVQLVFSCPGTSAVSEGVTDLLDQLGAVTTPWTQAIHTPFDLIVTASNSGNLNELNGPIVVMSHGVGYSKYSLGIANRESRIANRESRIGRSVYGLSSQWLLHDGEVVPEAIILSHDEQLGRLADEVPQALPRAVVAGDPCFDRLRLSVPLRGRYRRAFGVADGQKLVVVSSTWFSRSSFGSWPDLFRRLMAELPVDRYRVAGILHPNLWYGHGPFQVRLWLADCIRAGLMLVPPVEGWGAALIAADYVIGDHGAVTCYGAALDKPILLASFPDDDVAAGSCVDLLGKVAPRLDRDRSLLRQIEDAGAEFTSGRYDEVAGLITSRPGEAADRLRAVCYRLMDLPEPDIDPPVAPLTVDTLAQTTAAGSSRMFALLVAGTITDTGSVTLRRHAADALRGRRTDDEPRLLDPHLLAHVEHPTRSLRTTAGIVFCYQEDLPGPAPRWLDDTLASHPAAFLAAIVTDAGECLVRSRDGDEFLLSPRQGSPLDPLCGASAVYLWLTSPHRHRDPPTSLRIDAGNGQHTVDVRRA